MPILDKRYQINKNNRLKKHEARKNELQIDIYLPYCSQIGIPVKDLINKTNNIEDFILLNKNYLFVLKIHTLSQRERTPKGRKDLIDIISLLLKTRLDCQKIKK